METGKIVDNGFLPSSPGMKDLLERAGITSKGWEDLKNNPAAPDVEFKNKKQKEDLLRCYYQLFMSPAGQVVIEDLLNQSLRRSPYKPGGGASLEEQTAYGLERMGQNGFMTYILRMIHDGKTAPAPSAPAKKRKK